MKGEKNLEPKDEANIDNNASSMPKKVHLKTETEKNASICWTYFRFYCCRKMLLKMTNISDDLSPNNFFLY